MAERFVGRHVSTAIALQAMGVATDVAKRLALEARRSRNDEVRVDVAPNGAAVEHLVVRRRRGGHADVYRITEP